MNYTMPAQDTFDVGVVTPPSPALTDLARAYVRRHLSGDLEATAELLAMLGLA